MFGTGSYNARQKIRNALAEQFIVGHIKCEIEDRNLDGKVENSGDYKKHNVRNRMSKCPPFDIWEAEFPPINPLGSNTPLILKGLNVKEPPIGNQLL